MGILHESKEFFQLKDLEAVRPSWRVRGVSCSPRLTWRLGLQEGKKRGVTGMNAVKDLIEELVDDSQICKEKVSSPLQLPMEIGRS